ncbi:hypothetical protein NQ317_005291 [Molorchus minor]|uniref:Uncharacterized protein n=1 Tax=Molorchus minor TaxID=1323400 RepID=A0ABQ9JAY4_9CUCU|nr:hypothetical protein NQ317_005291 [Molorchus minor]
MVMYDITYRVLVVTNEHRADSQFL